MTGSFILANGLGNAADAFAMLFAFLFCLALIVVVGLLCMFTRVVPLLYLHCVTVGWFVILFQPWKYWTRPLFNSPSDPEWRSAQDVLGFITCVSICVMFFSILTVGVTVYGACMHHARRTLSARPKP